MNSNWRWLFDNEWLQRADLESLRSSARMRARSARRRHLETESRLDELEDELGEMRLFTRALLALLQENGALDPAQLRAKLLALDAEDGKQDGRMDKEEPSADKAPTPPPVPPRKRRP
ncbi:MAG: hypothetical protein O2894_05735 [Planctomycetota bacterium]|nr:hypothetical protein [Planctomycetota bacterium]